MSHALEAEEPRRLGIVGNREEIVGRYSPKEFGRDAVGRSRVERIEAHAAATAVDDIAIVVAQESYVGYAKRSGVAEESEVAGFEAMPVGDFRAHQGLLGGIAFEQPAVKPKSSPGQP